VGAADCEAQLLAKPLNVDAAVWEAQPLAKLLVLPVVLTVLAALAAALPEAAAESDTTDDAVGALPLGH